MILKSICFSFFTTFIIFILNRWLIFEIYTLKKFLFDVIDFFVGTVSITVIWAAISISIRRWLTLHNFLNLLLWQQTFLAALLLGHQTFRFRAPTRQLWWYPTGAGTLATFRFCFKHFLNFLQIRAIYKNSGNRQPNFIRNLSFHLSNHFSSIFGFEKFRKPILGLSALMLPIQRHQQRGITQVKLPCPPH